MEVSEGVVLPPITLDGNSKGRLQVSLHANRQGGHHGRLLATLRGVTGHSTTDGVKRVGVLKASGCLEGLEVILGGLPLSRRPIKFTLRVCRVIGDLAPRR
jgi:hypothetical protein